MTYEVAFNRLKKKFENVDAAKLEDMAIQITLSDEDCGGTFYAKVADGKLDVQPYDYRDNDAVADVTRDALSKILDGKQTIEKAVEKGVLTVKGDLSKVDAFAAAIKKAALAKKAPAKKTEKKAEVKAETKAEPAKKTAAKTEKKAPAKKTAKTEVKAEAKAEPAKKTAAKTEKKAPAKKTAKKTTK